MVSVACGATMFPGWAITVTWLMVTAAAALYYFAPVAQIVAYLE